MDEQITPEIQAEFGNAQQIKRPHRYLILERARDMPPDQPIVFFGLQHLNDEISYFCCTEEVTQRLALEFSGLAKASDLNRLSYNAPLPFSNSKMKVLHATHHMAALRSTLSAYGRRLRFVARPIEGDNQHVRLSFSEPIPNVVTLLLGDAVHNLRSALDLLICDLARLRGKRASKMKFPFADSESKFIDAVQHREVRRLGRDVQESLLSLKAYRGGNDLLRGLHELDIADKHNMIIPVMSVAWSTFDTGRFVSDQLAMTHPGKTIPKIAFLGGDYIDVAGVMRTLSVDGEIVPIEAMQYVSADPNVVATALFADGQPFARKHILETLDDIYKTVRDIIESFALKFGA